MVTSLESLTTVLRHPCYTNLYIVNNYLNTNYMYKLRTINSNSSEHKTYCLMLKELYMTNNMQL